MWGSRSRPSRVMSGVWRVLARRRRTSVSRVRENRTHGAMGREETEPVGSPRRTAQAPLAYPTTPTPTANPGSDSYGRAHSALYCA
jgi:hypothetical protein